MAGSLNYLWPTTFSLVLVNWLIKYTGKPLPLWKHVLLFFSCLAVGWSNESVSLPVSIGLFFYFLFNKSSYRNGAVSSVLGYALGAFFILISPGTWQRMQGWESVTSQRTLIQVLFIHSYNLAWGFIRNILPLCAMVVVLLFLGRNRWRFASVRKNMLAWLFLGFFCFLLALGWDEHRVFFGVSAFSLVIVLRTFRPYFSSQDRQGWFRLALIVLCAVPATTALRATAFYLDHDKQVYGEVRQAPSKCVIRERPYSGKSRYVYVTALEPDRYAFHNRVKSFYYRKEFIQALPDDLFDVVTSGKLASSLTPSNSTMDNYPLYTYGSYWILPVSEIPSKRLSVIFCYQKDNAGLKVHQKVFRYLFNTLDSSTEEGLCFGVESNGKKYLVIPQKSERNLIQIHRKDY